MTDPANDRLGRRALGLAGVGLLAARPGTSAAQGRPAAPAGPPAVPVNVVLPLPMPCADRPGDVAGLLLEGMGSPAGTVAVFGQVFRAGDLPAGATPGARLAAGAVLPAQFDVTTRHPDGSARFAVVSLALPALPAGARAAVVLTARGAPVAPPLDAPAVLAGRTAVALLTPDGGGVPWEADLLALLREARAAGLRPTQSGPLALAWRVTAPVPPAAAGTASLRLVADLCVRSDGTLWLDLWLRNDVAMRPGGGTANYALTLLLDGREALATGPIRHGHYQGWGRLVSGARGGRAAAPPPIIRPNAAYLAEAGAVARYDLSTGVETRFVASMNAARAAPDWAPPLARRSIVQAMGTGGGRPDLGPTTAWQAAWLQTGDPGAGAFVLDQAETAGAVPWHYWDPAGGSDGRGGWLDERRWPRFWSDPRGGRPPLTLMQPVPRDTGWGEDAAHQPALSYVPYLLTGRRAFLDNLQAQAAWNVSSNWPANRYDRSWSGPIVGLNVLHNRQVRSAAWALRTVDEAAWISPDDHPMAPYLREVSAANWAWARSRIPALTEMQGEAHGWWVPTAYGPRGETSPWQQDYMAGTAAAAARMGNADARAVLAWMRNFVVGRFTAGDRGFAPHDGSAYIIAMVPPDAPRGPPYRTWSEIGERTRVLGVSNGEGWRHSQGEYTRLALQSLAQVRDVLGDEEAGRVFLWLSGAGAPFTDPGSHARSPTYNIVPRGFARVPSRAPRCAPGA